MRAPDDDKDNPGVTKHIKYYTRMSESDSNVEMSNLPESKTTH